MPGDLQKPSAKRERSRASRRAKILSIAGQSFLTNGYAGTSMSAIAARLGGSKSTLWGYFPSKEVLFEAAIDQIIESHHARLSESLAPRDEIVPALTQFAKNLLETATSPNAIALHRLVQGESGRFPEVGDIFSKRVTNRTRELLAGFLAVAMTRELLRQDDPLIGARVFIALCTSGLHQRLMFGRQDAVTPAAIAKDAILATDVFMRAYSPAPRPR